MPRPLLRAGCGGAGLCADAEQPPRLRPAASPPALPLEVAPGGRAEPVSVNPPHLWGWSSQSRPPGPTQVREGSRCQPCWGKCPEQQASPQGEGKTRRHLRSRATPITSMAVAEGKLGSPCPDQPRPCHERLGHFPSPATTLACLTQEQN